MFEVSGHTGTLKKLKKRFKEASDLHMNYPTSASGRALFKILVYFLFGKTEVFRITLMCLIGAAYLPGDCCFSELAR